MNLQPSLFDAPARSMKDQARKVLEHMRTHGSITDLEALRLYRIRRLSARIYELRHDFGHDIGKVMEAGEGEGVHYARYFLRRQERAA